jgi:hypothetical protein
MRKKFALQDDGTVKAIPNPTAHGDADDAGRQLDADVLMTFNKKELQNLQRQIDGLIKENEIAETLATLKKMPLKKALWWFIENTNDDSPCRSSCFFELRARMSTGK